MQPKLLSKVHEIGRITVNEFDKIFPQGKDASLVFFYTLNEKGSFSKTVEKTNGAFLYFYELNETGNGMLRTLGFEKKLKGIKKSLNAGSWFLLLLPELASPLLHGPYLTLVQQSLRIGTLRNYQYRYFIFFY